LAMIFVGLVFAGFGLFIATKAKNIQTFQAVSMAITMPMTFLSGAYIPLSMLNDFLTTVAYFNPMTYAVIFFRAIVLERIGDPTDQLIMQELAFEIGNFTIEPLHAALMLVVFGVLFLILSTISFVRLDFSRMNRNKNDSLEIE
ncbi:MAG: ABC transporter permease, partial [Coriobacteriia bacterium]|nr:ABC transporter permease [Coriobacteriia bacterium]